MLDLTFFMSSTILYSIVSKIIKVLDEEGALEVVGREFEEGVEDFFTIPLSLVRGAGDFYFWFAIEVSASPLLLDKASSSSSFSKVVIMKSRKPWAFANYSSWDSSADKANSSSSSSWFNSTFDIMEGGDDYDG